MKRSRWHTDRHGAELLSICVGNEGLEGLEARVDALHAPPFVAVGNLPPNPPLLVPLGLRGQWNVGKAAKEHRGRLRLYVL